MQTLDQISPGHACVIHSIGGPPALVQRLVELGIMEGERLYVIARAPLGDPIEIESPLTRLSLRAAEAATIQVTPTN